jgi:hypothetical protein
VDPGRSEQTNPPASPDQHASTQASEPPESADDISTLLGSGGETTLVVVPVDPNVVHCQWEVAPADIENAKRALGVGEHEFWPVLQFYDVTNAARKGAPRELSFAVGVQLQASNWFVPSCRPDRSYRADLALRGEDGRFVVIASSNPVQTPPFAPSNYADEQWLPIRMEPRQPESATPVRSPISLALEPPSGAPSESAESPVRLPIDMREEVRSKLAALYGEQQREAPASPLQDQLSVPVDMQEELKILTKLYEGPGWEIPSLARHPFFIQEFSFERILPESTASLEMKPSALADLTELNERSFTSGISSRTK